MRAGVRTPRRTGFLRPMEAGGAGGGKAAITLAELVDAVASESRDALEAATVVSHMLRTRRATWLRPVSPPEPTST